MSLTCCIICEMNMDKNINFLSMASKFKRSQALIKQTKKSDGKIQNFIPPSSITHRWSNISSNERICLISMICNSGQTSSIPFQKKKHYLVSVTIYIYIFYTHNLLRNYARHMVQIDGKKNHKWHVKCSRGFIIYTS